MNYVDIRELHPDYSQVPCKECDTKIWAHKSFTYNHDYSFCDEHSPLDRDYFYNTVEVNL